jgi:hypothetical protein
MNKLTLVDIVELLVRWDIVHSKNLKELGRCDFDKERITISNRQSYTEMVNTIYHELLHAKYEQYLLEPKEQEINDMSDFLSKQHFKYKRKMYGIKKRSENK